MIIKKLFAWWLTYLLISIITLMLFTTFDDQIVQSFFIFASGIFLGLSFATYNRLIDIKNSRRRK